MSNQSQNRNQYQAMMNDVHAPAELLGKVRSIPMEKAKKRNYVLKCATAACAALLGVFVVTNGVCYAATGETWVEKATIWVNGEPQEVDVQMSQNGEVTTGTVEYTVEDADGEGGDITLSMSIEGGDVNDGTFEIIDYTKEGAPAVETLPCQVLESKDGGVIVSVEGVEPIDVTSQLKEHGAAVGTFDKDGKTYVYKVSGTSGNYHASVEAEESPSAEVDE